MSQSLRIVFMGTPDFATAALHHLLDGPDEVVAVVSQPDKKKGRGKKLSSPPVKIMAEEHGIPVLQPVKIKDDEFENALRSFHPDVIIVAAYGRILPENILNLAPHGCINVHGSILPKYRGAAPIQWAVINGEKEAGVTIMQMDKGMDTGDILHIKKIKPSNDETAGSLFHKLAELGGKTLMEALELLKKGDLSPTPQDDSLSCHAPMLKKEDGLIRWDDTAIQLDNRIRGLDPWPCAFTFLENRRFRLFKPEVVYKDSDTAPGTILRADKSGLLISTSENCLLIREIQPDGKKRMEAGAYINGHPIPKGSCFTTQQ